MGTGLQRDRPAPAPAFLIPPSRIVFSAPPRVLARWWGRVSFCAILAAGFPASAASTETWRGLVVEPEFRCSPYRGEDYPYPPSVELEIVAELGKIYSPYTGQCFGSVRQTDIEHIVARSEAHDSGLCRASAAVRERFSSDLLNLTLADPVLNRYRKRAYDASRWTPARNRCWFAHRVLAVRLKHGLSVDRREADALERILSSCATAEIESPECRSMAKAPAARPEGLPEDVEALRLWDDDGNGRITCREARRHGIAPVPRGHQAYPLMRDGDGDGMVCE